ncbi:hypothetical protein K474DRAFT_1680296 [Panus rudis PR-1116 ss-1]|nr:hypothetical protein K474DRAFT_1680296 [Panus rudis PR-1116 ss-1]
MGSPGSTTMGHKDEWEVAFRQSKPILPLDVIYSIVAQLADDIPSLRACSLVSKDFTRACRHFKWRRLVLDDRNKALTWVERFRDVPGLRPYIKELGFNLVLMHDLYGVIIFCQILKLFSGALDNVRALDICRVILRQTSFVLVPFIHSFKNGFKSVTRLTMEDIQLPISILHTVLGSLKNLTEFRFHRLVIDLEGNPEHNLPQQLGTLRLRKLWQGTVSCANPDAPEFDFLGWISRIAPVDALRQLTVVRVITASHVIAVDQFIQRIGGNLEELELEWGSIPRNDATSWHKASTGTLPCLTLKHNHNVRCLRIHDPSNPFVYPLLDELPNPGNLRRVCFRMHFRSTQGDVRVRNKDYLALDTLLSAKRFSNVEQWTSHLRRRNFNACSSRFTPEASFK